MSASTPNVKVLVLDAGPLLSLTPLRGLSERYVTVPHVIAELKDKRAREYFERLAITSGMNVEILSPDVLSLAKVTVFAKKTGDYSVLSQADLHVLALTYGLHEESKSKSASGVSNDEDSQKEDKSVPEPNETTEIAEPSPEGEEAQSQERDCTAEEGENDDREGSSREEQVEEDLEERETLLQQLERDAAEPSTTDDPTLEKVGQTEDDAPPSAPLKEPPAESLFEDPPSSDDGEGEWITPANVALHKSRALSLLPEASSSKKGERQDGGPIDVACMTADYAMQNVLLQMGLNLVGIEGKRIQSVKSWVLRCHACFKICKDSSKKFCPSCGNPTLLRTSVTTTAASPDSNTPAMTQVHLKKNFQYRNRGTMYSIPLPKPGKAKGGGAGNTIILREDQVEFQRGVKREEFRIKKEDKKVANALAAAEKGDGGVTLKSWADPDWMPDMLLGKSKPGSGLPVVGYGRRNPNEVRKTKK